MANDDLHLLDEWFGRILAGLAPGERLRAALKLGQALRRSNIKRIGDNVEPDGNPMVGRRPRLDRRGRLRDSTGSGKMFKGLRYSKHWKVDASADGVEVRPANGLIDRLASTNQFGETVVVGRLRGGQAVRAKYSERRLLGFSEEDQRLAVDIAADMIAPYER